jgi:hypothetical protein
MIVIFLASVEIGVRGFIVSASRIERRIEREYAEARRIRRDPAVKQLLVVGNSLLLKDVEFESLRDALSPKWIARRLVVEQTAYFDWLYGLQALFKAGAAPDAVALVLSGQQLLSSEFRGDYTAYRLMRPVDVLPLARDLRLHPTVTSRYLVSSVSAFYGLRAELRKVLLARLIPDVTDLTRLLVEPGAARSLDPSAYPTALERLMRLRSLTDEFGVRLLVVPAPLLGRSSAYDPVRDAAASSHISFVDVTTPGTYSPQDFSDGFHMNERGAARYTRMLSAALNHTLQD